jgi:hypothetical protein
MELFLARRYSIGFTDMQITFLLYFFLNILHMPALVIFIMYWHLTQIMRNLYLA